MKLKNFSLSLLLMVVLWTVPDLMSVEGLNSFSLANEESPSATEHTAPQSDTHGEEHSDSPKLHFQKTQAQIFDKSTKIPKSLVKEIEKLYVQHFRVINQESPLTDEEVQVNIPRRYLSLAVELFDPSGKSLDHNTRYEAYKRSGSVDLSHDVMSSSGSFFLRLKASVEGVKEPIDQGAVRLFFVSQTKKRKIENEIYGADCDQWLDISTFYQTSLSQAGLKLHVKDQRYLNVIGGIFYFVYFSEGSLYLSTLTLQDSRYLDVNCQRKRGTHNG